MDIDRDGVPKTQWAECVGSWRGGHHEVVDGDLTNYFGEIPHAELIESVARRVSDGRMLKWIKAWLEMPVEEDDGKRRQAPAGTVGGGSGRGTPQGAPDLTAAEQSLHEALRAGLEGAGGMPGASAGRSSTMRMTSVWWGKAAAAEMLEAVKRIMEELKATGSTSGRPDACGVPEEALEFLGYRIGTQLSP